MRYLSGEYNIWWGHSSGQAEQLKNTLRNWLNERNLIASESPDFSYYVDQDGNKQGIGWITVAKLENPFSTEKEFRDEILNKLNIYRMSAFDSDNKVAECAWDYKWSDPNYVQNEIEHLREFFPR